MNINFKGTRWFKCDLHLHTTASRCFQDQTVTAEQWVQRALDQGLNCVAVTDHNTGDSVDAVKAAAVGTDLIVFPGVEITCDTSKVHLLILFDVTKTTSDINDFLIRCDIDREMFADQLASTTQTIFQIAEKANEHGALVIPAHIDEYNGLGSISNDNTKTFFELPYINAVQVVHKEFTNPTLQTSENVVFRTYLNDYYNNPSPSIDYSKMSEWHRPVKIALTQKLAIVTFSDNPHEPKNPKHGLAGMGTRYTWIKMDERPTLEGLRQAFLLPTFRVKNDFDSPNIPYQVPDLWFKSITVIDSVIGGSPTPLKVDFNPQLNTIIGGRGSGKSSILRFIRGLFNRTSDISQLQEIIQDHNEFYKREEGRPKKGVLKDSTRIEIEFVRNSILHKLTALNVKSSVDQSITIYKYNDLTSSWIQIEDDGYIDFFEFEHYSQKQIYEIAQEPNSLRERIDNAISGIAALHQEKEVIKRSFFEKSTTIRTIQQQVSGKGKLQTEIRDLEANIALFQQSGISGLLSEKEAFATEVKLTKGFSDEIAKRENDLEKLISEISLRDIDYTNFRETYSEQIKILSKVVVDGFENAKLRLEEIKQTISALKQEFRTEGQLTEWYTDREGNREAFEAKRLELEAQGINDIANFELLTNSKSAKETELGKIAILEANLTLEVAERSRLQSEYLIKAKAITQLRKTFVGQMAGDNVKILIKPLRNHSDFIQKIRKILQREGSSFQEDIDLLASVCFDGNVEQKINAVREIFFKLRKGERVEGISGFFVNLVAGINDAQMDEIELLLPEDEIEVQYRINDSAPFKSLTVASSGQKTTAILTFILSFGKVPLLLDQPEDDLDNRLVYDLVVDRLKKAKDNRQIIVVTHNANIPVNGDSEYIISMSSESNTLTVLHTGTVEQSVIKKEICDVMEGSEQAFLMRSMRYKTIVAP
jgi:PHP family Zn ribbon phosphoesterase